MLLDRCCYGMDYGYKDDSVMDKKEKVFWFGNCKLISRFLTDAINDHLEINEGYLMTHEDEIITRPDSAGSFSRYAIVSSFRAKASVFKFMIGKNMFDTF